jgi:phenylpyruvate tautomerase PptA (4-oxalocrotonate tautomerase family)
MRRILLAALAVSVFVACQPATTELTEEQKAEIAAEIRQVVAEFWQTAVVK